MARYIFSRLLQSFFVLLLMSFIIYWLIGLVPGDPLDILISRNPELSSKDAEHLKNLFGLNRSIFDRYTSWLINFLSGDLGFSRLYSIPVLSAIIPAFKNTLLLMGASFCLAFLLALPSGIFAAMKPYSKADYTINFLAFVGISIPPFWLALLLIIIFSVYLGVLPTGVPIKFDSLGDLFTNFEYLILPVISLTLASVGSHIRYIRASLIEVLRLDFIKTARAKGLTQMQCLISHAFRASLVPIVTILSLDFGYLFSGAVITETIFSFPGMGKLIFDSVMGNDFNLALSGLLFATFFTLSGSFIADVLYILLDPRISYRLKSR